MSAVTRREFLQLAAAAAISTPHLHTVLTGAWQHPYAEVAKVDRSWVLAAARKYLDQEPRTITSVRAARSAGGLHDYYSEGDYWWPNPKDPSGPYIRRDGMSNPANFVAHRDLLIRLSIQMPALTTAWLLTGRRDFADHAVAHLRAWFVDPATRMNPNLEYAQAIHGRDTGRSIGIIDTVHLVEVAQAALALERGTAIDPATQRSTRQWFAEYLNWLTTSSQGLEERAAKNNHGSCWVLQAAEFATYTGNEAVRGQCRERFRNTLVPAQIAPDGRLPLELARTKPYSYCLFDLDILGMNAHVLSTADDDLWQYQLPGGSGLQTAFRFMVPYIRNKSSWSFRHDVEYYDDLPVRQPSLLFAGLAYTQPGYLQLWERLNPEPSIPEIIRNHPVRQPLLWMHPQRVS
ncbi:MAG TPA: alginate lyase family protein [Acidobacteriaceae bacterium]|nr:alginate lyase family protein [Acidobacteriaceae bacterium]